MGRVKTHVERGLFEKVDRSDRAISAWQHLGKGKATPENRVVLRFHTASVDSGPRWTCQSPGHRHHVALAPFVADPDGSIPFCSATVDSILSRGLDACCLEANESDSLTARPKSYSVYT